jgi:hypothetical protein
MATVLCKIPENVINISWCTGNLMWRLMLHAGLFEASVCLPLKMKIFAQVARLAHLMRMTTKKLLLSRIILVPQDDGRTQRVHDTLTIWVCNQAVWNSSGETNYRS